MCAAQVSSARGGAWLVFSRLPSPDGGGDSWCFTAILQKQVEQLKGYTPAVRPGKLSPCTNTIFLAPSNCGDCCSVHASLLGQTSHMVALIVASSGSSTKP